MTNTQRSRLGLLRLVIVGTIALPTFAATTSDVELFGRDVPLSDAALLSAPPPILFVVVGVSMVVWAVGRRHFKSVQALRAAHAEV